MKGGDTPHGRALTTAPRCARGSRLDGNTLLTIFDAQPRAGPSISRPGGCRSRAADTTDQLGGHEGKPTRWQPALRPTDQTGAAPTGPVGFYCARARSTRRRPVRRTAGVAAVRGTSPIAGGGTRCSGRAKRHHPRRTSVACTCPARSASRWHRPGAKSGGRVPVEAGRGALASCGRSSAQPLHAVGAINAACHNRHSGNPGPLLAVCAEQRDRDPRATTAGMGGAYVTEPGRACTTWPADGCEKAGPTTRRPWM